MNGTRVGQVPSLRLGGEAVPMVGRCRVYVCGITPYDVTHLGHAATFAWVDLAVRVLHRLGTPVDVCRNITDVDDVLFAAARREGVYYDRLAAVQQFAFDRDMASIGVGRPAFEPRAHNFVDAVVQLATALLDRDAAYLRDGTVFFRGAAVAAGAGVDRSAALSHLAEAGEHRDGAEDELDVAVWRASAEGEPAWPSPWGPGRPGWHAECAAMVLAVYGHSVDLHAGGKDLRFPHHAYEAALAEQATGVAPFARSWMHVGTVNIDGAKMAKSAGNLVFVAALVERYGAAAVRMLLLDRPWAADWDYAEAGMQDAAARVEVLHSAAGRPGGSAAASEAVVAALLDDLDVPAAYDVAVAEGGAAARELTTLLGV